MRSYLRNSAINSRCGSSGSCLALPGVNGATQPTTNNATESFKPCSPWHAYAPNAARMQIIVVTGRSICIPESRGSITLSNNGTWPCSVSHQLQRIHLHSLTKRVVHMNGIDANPKVSINWLAEVLPSTQGGRGADLLRFQSSVNNQPFSTTASTQYAIKLLPNSLSQVQSTIKRVQ